MIRAVIAHHPVDTGAHIERAPKREQTEAAAEECQRAGR